MNPSAHLEMYPKPFLEMFQILRKGGHFHVSDTFPKAFRNVSKLSRNVSNVSK